ncbi:universal stress protein [Crocosphaera sp.]|uniref:universal stress protein n=1 Tax=Crocosphaera sp. TaxID=2729996 RepID=UPI00263A23FD|nr:universal stress protein [Crocosphaera sp.]MDJ0580443.1 universal stress protein [Crocosphaera sp.]
MSQKILVALASSEDAKIVLPKAIKIVEKNNSILKLFHCINSEVYLTPYGAFSTPEINQLVPKWRENLEEETEKVKQWLTEYSQQTASKGIQTEWDYLMGNPSSSIIKTAKDWNADLIIMGRRGLTGLSEMFLGSVSNYVVHHASCSVLLIQ